jgi:hypothetical protein
MANNSVVGRWQLKSWRLAGADGDTFPLGPDAGGTVLYTSDGFMSVMMMAAERPAVGWPPATMPASAEDTIAAFATFVGYSGRYEVQGENVLHHVEIASTPTHVGTHFTRGFVVNGNELQLTHRTPSGSEGRLIWERIA